MSCTAKNISKRWKLKLKKDLSFLCSLLWYRNEIRAQLFLFCLPVFKFVHYLFTSSEKDAGSDSSSRETTCCHSYVWFSQVCCAVFLLSIYLITMLIFSNQCRTEWCSCVYFSNSSNTFSQCVTTLYCNVFALLFYTLFIIETSQVLPFISATLGLNWLNTIVWYPQNSTI